MGRPNTTSRCGPTANAATKPITDNALAAFEKSPAAKNSMVKRIIHALRTAWADKALNEDELRRECLARAEESRTRVTRPVLVVVHVDGWVEIYAEPGTSVSTLELSVMDSEDECDWRTKVPYPVKHLLQRTPTRTAFPRYLNRPNQYTDEALVRSLGHVQRLERDERITEWAQQALERLKLEDREQ